MEQRMSGATEAFSNIRTPDVNPELGQPVILNGLLLSKIHHAAFDSHLIGIDPDY